jgi:hypothetical protein
VRHIDRNTFEREALRARVAPPEWRACIDIALHCYYRRDALKHLNNRGGADIACMQDALNPVQRCQGARVEVAVGIRNNTNAHGCSFR